ncbi:MAG TPA: alpha/beta hydrolase [Actinomycetota bacterium]|nr:alpha/beta hydrolase [Actinomycetota bacterium]
MLERAVQAGSTEIFHREVGNGPAILMLHGFPQTGHCWRGVAERLSSRFRVLAPDVPGFGASAAPPVHDAATVARILFDYLEAVDAPQAVVAGHDWGGAFALWMALDRPDRVRRLVLTNTAFRELSPLHSWYIWLFNIPLLPELAFRFTGDQILSVFLRGATPAAQRSVFEGEPLRIYQEAYSDPERVASALAYYRTVTRKALTRQVRVRLGRGVVRTDAIDGGGRREIEMPTLIVWGMKDPALPPSLLRGMKRDIPQAEIVELDDVGHFVPEEAPDELATAIDAFVA